MIDSMQVSPAHYAGLTFFDPEPARRKELMQMLSARVSEDDPHALEDLLNDPDNVRSIAVGIKESRSSPLHFAAAHRKDAALAVLVQKLPIDVWNARDEGGRTPLMLGAEQGHQQFVRDLHDALIKVTAACRMMPDGQRLEVERRLKAEFGCVSDHGEAPTKDFFDSIWSSMSNAKDIEGNTAALLAFKNRQYSCCSTLLFWGADGAIENRDGESVKSLGAALPEAIDLYCLMQRKRLVPPDQAEQADPSLPKTTGPCLIL